MTDRLPNPPFTPDRWLTAAVVALALVRAGVGGTLGLSDDESYYRMWSLAPALSYFDHPPMVAYMIAMGRWLAGDTALGVRLLSNVAFLIGFAAIWRTACILFDAETADRTGWILLTMPLLAVGGIIITPDAPSVLFSSLVLWSIAELHRTQNPNWWLAAGIFAGLGLISKYTNLFTGATIAIWILASPARRQWFRHWQLWGGGIIALAIVTPVLIWNAQHEWVSFAKQFGRVVRGHDVTAKYFLEMAGAFLALAGPVTAMLALAGLIALTARAIATRTASATLLSAAILPLLIYFSVHAGHARVQANWLAPLYPPLAVCASVALGSLIAVRYRRTVLVLAATSGLAAISAVYWHAVTPISLVTLRKDATHQLHGWQHVADEADALRIQHGASWLATSSYATTSQLMFALKTRTEVHQLNERIRYSHIAPPSRALFELPALYIELERRADLVRLERTFKSVKKISDIVRTADGKPVAVYTVYLVSKPAGPIF